LSGLEIVVLPHNRSSLRVAEKIGAKPETEARNRLMFRGQPSNALVLSLMPGDLSGGDPTAASNVG